MDTAKELDGVINGIDVPFIKSHFAYLDMGTMACAAKSLAPETMNKVFEAIGPAETTTLKNKIGALGTLPPHDIENAQMKILSMMRTAGKD